ncbi:serine/threonine-protein kinase [Actinacidiphila soli]|uniref:serine/threonine-protein kinase n=1 Tax=Actinacidiphila soli TaxID=2487275 RepID=UPI000FCC5ECD|nr:serine/threonine-protein kinase [Actinacidiphila soli]
MAAPVVRLPPWRTTGASRSRPGCPAGLAAAHRQGVVHRDIKPDNLMQDALGTLKVGDFGIARFVDDASAGAYQHRPDRGHQPNLAPERALGKPAGPGSDVYALGCVLHQLLAGEPPFQADTAPAVLHLHVDAPPPPASLRCPQLPGAFEQYLLRMLAKRPEDRPNAQGVADWFADAAWRGGAQQMHTLPPTTAQPSAANPRRRAPQGQQRAASRAQMLVRIRAHLRRHKMLKWARASAGMRAAKCPPNAGQNVRRSGVGGQPLECRSRARRDPGRRQLMRLTR